MTDQISLAGWSLVRRFRREQDPLSLPDQPPEDVRNVLHPLLADVSLYRLHEEQKRQRS